MKKLLAILLSMLMLCTMIPFATVSAADEATIEIYVEETELNAGDEFEVTVNLLNIPEPGLIGAKVELDYDQDVLELVTYYDEDEEDDFNMIEVGSKYNASSNKYITPGPLGKCSILYLRATAKETQTRYEEWFYTATFKVKDDAISGDYTIGVKDYNPKDFVRYGNLPTDFAIEAATITVNGQDPEPPSCEHEYAYDCSKNCSKCGEETRPEAEHEFFNDCDTVCMICYEEVREASHNVIHVAAKDATCTAIGNIEYWYCDVCGAAWLNAECTMPTNLRAVNLPMAEHTYFDDCSAICDVCGYEREVSHNVIHVEAKAPTCTELGNIEYWYCDVCGAAWLDEACTLNTNMMAVKLGATCSTNAIYTAAKDATCFEPGNVEYWYCANCDVYYLDAACTIITNAKSVILPIAHNVIHVEAKDPTCTENGNIEYWYCDVCGQAWLDEYCHLNTNLKAVVLAASCSYNAVYTEAKAPTCYEPGNVEYWYCANCDVYYADAACTIVTNAKNVILPISHNIIHVAAKAPTCYEPGNIEYWYCADCGQAWLDELCHLNTNLKAVVLPVAHNIIHVAAKAATCTETGNIEYWYCADCGQAWLDELCHLNTNLKAVVLPLAEHTYANDTDVDCDICGAIREVKFDIITGGMTSISEDVNGLAFKFDVDAEHTVLNTYAKLNEETADKWDVIASDLYIDYNNCLVTPDVTGEYKLVEMGATVDNGVQVKYVTALKVVDCTKDAPFYAIRVLNIPEAHFDTEITCTPYYVYENAEGEIIVVWGEAVVASYNSAAAK